MNLTSSWIALCLTIVLVAVFVSAGIFLVVRGWVRTGTLRKHHDFAGFVIATLGTLYSVFLGFTIVGSQERQGHILEKVNKEAYLCGDLYRATAAFGEPIRGKAQGAIKEYLKSIVVDEWPLMGEKKESPLTLEKMEGMWAEYYKFQPGTEVEKIWFGKTVNILLDLNSARLERIYSSWESLGMISWIALILGGVVLLSLLFFFGTENFWAQLSINTLFVGYFAFMIYVVYALDNPFREPQIIQPKAYQIIYNYYSENPREFVSPEENRLF